VDRRWWLWARGIQSNPTHLFLRAWIKDWLLPASRVQVSYLHIPSCSWLHWYLAKTWGARVLFTQMRPIWGILNQTKTENWLIFMYLDLLLTSSSHDELTRSDRGWARERFLRTTCDFSVISHSFYSVVTTELLKTRINDLGGAIPPPPVPSPLKPRCMISIVSIPTSILCVD
jgi:hypothetical protein